MTSPRWKKIELGKINYIKKTDFWVYAREYIPKRGYVAGETNSLIANFKKSYSKKNISEEWQYRTKALEKFKEEIIFLIGDLKADIAITAVPSSLKKDDPKYNHRFEDLFNLLKKSQSNLSIEYPVEIKKSTSPSHLSGNRDPNLLKKNYIWKGFKNKEPKTLFIVDDVITSGAHLRAMSDFILKNKFKGKIIGICWARSLNQDEL